jgi:hypothetical protein
MAHEAWGTVLAGVVGDGTQYCWTILRKRAGGCPAAGPARVSRRSDALATSKKARLAPRTGDLLHRADRREADVEEVDADSLTVVIDGQRLVPCYAGPRGTMLLRDAGPRLDSGQPADSTGLAGWRLTSSSVETAGMDERSARRRSGCRRSLRRPPRIVAINNGLRRRISDIETSGPKSNLRALVGDLSRSISVEEALRLPQRTGAARRRTALPCREMASWEIALEEGPLDPGELSIIVRAGELEESSPPAKCEVRG